jgi:transcriptional regulator with XRE-family HTH domain
MREWFRNIRIKKELTQLNVAEIAGVDVTTISKIELGERRPSPELAKAIAKVLDFDWTLFYPDEEDKKDKEAV